ncbi:rpmA, partial [Symbiodinium pilosum]
MSYQAASSGMSATLLLGASAVAMALARRRATLARRVWTYMPIEGKDCPGLGKQASGPLWRQYMNLHRQSKKTMGRKVRYLKQQRILRDHNVWWGWYGKWHTWNPHPGIKNLYQGPESHPDNPDFPAPNSGLQAFGGSRPVAPASSRSAFVAGRAPTMGSAKRAVLSATRARSGLVMKAHKKAAASTKNQGNSRNPHHWGVKALAGKAVKVRQRLVKQRAMTWYPGNNVKMCKDMSLIAMRDGIVQWRGDYRHKE